MNDWFFFLCRFLHAKLRKRLMQGVPEKNKQQLIKTSRVFGEQSKKYRIELLSDDSHYERMSSYRKHNPVNDLCVSESITTVAKRARKKKRKIMQFSSRKIYEVKQKAIICVLVGEQQFCKIFPSSWASWKKNLVEFSSWTIFYRQRVQRGELAFDAERWTFFYARVKIKRGKKIC